MSKQASGKASSKSKKDKSDSRHPMEEILDDMSSIAGDEYRGRDGIEEGASKRMAGRSGKDKSSKGSRIDKNALLRGELSDIHPEKS